jgi:hypothetical protein
MIEWLCNAALSYTPQDFNHWLSGMGAVATGVGTIGLAYAAVRAIPRAIAQRHKSREIIRLYQNVIYRIYRGTEASEGGMALSLPQDLHTLIELLIRRHPELGSSDDARKLMDDLMLDNYFKSTVGNQIVERIAKWEPKGS